MTLLLWPLFGSGSLPPAYRHWGSLFTIGNAPTLQRRPNLHPPRSWLLLEALASLSLPHDCGPSPISLPAAALGRPQSAAQFYGGQFIHAPTLPPFAACRCLVHPTKRVSESRALCCAPTITPPEATSAQFGRLTEAMLPLTCPTGFVIGPGRVLGQLHMVIPAWRKTTQLADDNHTSALEAIDLTTLPVSCGVPLPGSSIRHHPIRALTAAAKALPSMMGLYRPHTAFSNPFGK